MCIFCNQCTDDVMDMRALHILYRRNKFFFHLAFSLLAISLFALVHLSISIESGIEHFEKTIPAVPQYTKPVPVALVDKILELKYSAGNPSWKHFYINNTMSTNMSVGLNVPFILNNVVLCHRLARNSAIILIYSATWHSNIRNTIRNTWGRRHPSILRSVFLLGKPTEADDQIKIRLEFEQFRDIVQGDFMDTYRNLSNKGFMGWRWVKEFCPIARIVVKVDDDVILNTHRLSMYFIPQYAEKHNFIAGNIQMSKPLLRQPEWIWARNENEQEAERTSPNYRYFDGNIVMMSRSTMIQLYEMAFSTPFLWIEDIYLYGILLSKLDNVELINIGKNYSGNKIEHFMYCYIDLSYNCEKLAVAEVKNPDVMTMVWQVISKSENERIHKFSKKFAVRKDIDN